MYEAFIYIHIHVWYIKKALTVRASSVGKQLKLFYVNEAHMPQRSPEYETQYKNMSNLMADLRKVYCFCSCSSSWSTIIFQTVWHFASASRLNFSHDDFLTDSDWVFKINELAYQTESQPMHWPIVHRVRSVCISSRFYKTRGQ